MRRTRKRLTKNYLFFACGDASDPYYGFCSKGVNESSNKYKFRADVTVFKKAATDWKEADKAMDAAIDKAAGNK